jgi:hypothetical protein
MPKKKKVRKVLTRSGKLVAPRKKKVQGRGSKGGSVEKADKPFFKKLFK